VRNTSAAEKVLDAWLAKVGEKIAHERIRRGLTVYALAKSADISRQQLANLEAGDNTSLRLLGKVLLAMGLSLNLPTEEADRSPSDDDERPDSEQAEVAAAVEESLRALSRAHKLLQLKDRRRRKRS
jgi:transcriptional regulator with XRE-family HTH domain